ncbi:MAG: DNA-directed RNA polymerase subunit beta' [Chloroflexi bacterium]|nr:DNA-directed RNA polymerase subunit beta' [Chloroflexota bacterium]
MEAKDFSALRISLASPEQIRSWSYGEVTKPETINYRRLRPEKDGLFCEAIFGPTKDWQCYCGKYKNIRYKGIICDKCGVEVTRASVRRERMGHIELAAPVAHVWYTRRVPSYLGLLLDVNRRDLDRVLYFAQYVITTVDQDARNKALGRLSEETHRQEEQIVGELDGQVKEILLTRDDTLSKLQQDIDAIHDHYIREQERLSEAVTAEGQRIQSQIEKNIGKVLDSEIEFTNASSIIVRKGEKVSNQHLELVNAAATARLNEIMAEIDEQRTADLASLDAQVDEITNSAADQIENLRMDYDGRLEDVRDKSVKTKRDLENLQPIQFLGEQDYRNLKAKYGQVFKADMGAEAFYEILKNMDLDKLAKELWQEVRTTRSKQRRKKATQRLRVVEALRVSNNRPEWMILTVLPVIPPDLRPMVQLDGGRFATSDLNDLYRRVINRNNRLKRLLELGAPDVIVRNEKRMLQEAVDSLIDNGQRGRALSRRGRRELKSLSNMLKGKKGRFRRNLLGKRVDYSGRSVIVIGPNLKLYQCGLPKTMALELYRPFVIGRLVAENYASNVKGAKRIIERERPEVWEVLEEVIKDRPVLLNRAPTLHRLGIQAFEPQLVEGKAIQIHPLVCAAFNADFDGDQMAMHVPLSQKAVQEARELMLSSRNLLKPADGSPVVGPNKDMVLGIYYMTMDPTAEIICTTSDADKYRYWSTLDNAGVRIGVAHNTAGSKETRARSLDQGNEIVVYHDQVNDLGKVVKGKDATSLLFEGLVNGEVDVIIYNAYEGQQLINKKKYPFVVSNLLERRVVADLDEVEALYQLGIVGLHTPILLGNYFDSPEIPAPEHAEVCTVGRAIFNRILPDELRFQQGTFGKKQLQDLVAITYQRFGSDRTTDIVDAVKNLGFHYATVSGTTISIFDITVPEEREEILANADRAVNEAERNWRRGLLTEEERYQSTIDNWNMAKDKLQNIIRNTLDPFGPIAVMAISGSTKGGFGPITQIAGMRGLMADPSGRIIDLPIRSHFRMGLTALEYFISTHGARKGQADTALRTADAGYMTRRLVDVAQDVIVNRQDCGTHAGIWILNPHHENNRHKPEANIAGQSFQERILGRLAAKTAIDPRTGEIIVDRNEMITEAVADALAEANVETLYVRSPMTCALIHGICAYCYGRDLGRGELVRIGEAVGIVAAQSIGEPGTQLTLRTFHTGGTAEASGDITSGLPRVEEIFEARKNPKGEAVMTDIGGTLRFDKQGDVRIARIIDSKVFNEEHDIPIGWDLQVEDEAAIREGQVIASEANGDGEIRARMNGTVHIEGHMLYIRYEKVETVEYEIPSSARLCEGIADGVTVAPGQQLTEGSKNPHRILRVLGADATQLYLLNELQEVYRNQGVNIADKHFEIMIRKMLSKVQTTRSGDSGMLPGELIDKLALLNLNDRLLGEGKEPAAGVPVLLGITKAALSTDSFLSAASFQHTIKVLAGAAIEGKVDRLFGLKENVIIGKLIPAGTGFHTYKDRDIIAPTIDLAEQGALATDEAEDEYEDEYDYEEEDGDYVDGALALEVDDEEEHEFEEEEEEVEVDFEEEETELDSDPYGED